MIIDLNIINKIAEKAGNEILRIYESDNFGIEIKSDNSPLTKADKASNTLIEKELIKFYPEIPILSEEGKNISFDIRKKWEYFWLVDPLDGTKEFIKKNGEFTVNIALIKNKKPIAGVIYAPALNLLYYGSLDQGAFKRDENRTTKKITADSANSNKLIAVKSRSHSSEHENKVLSQYGVTDSISIGSSLKFCLVAEGKAHLYYRHGPTWEWDTAAGHAIVNSAGGTVSNENCAFYYNKETLLNTSFIVKGSVLNANY